MKIKTNFRRTRCAWCGKGLNVGKEEYHGKKGTKQICNKCIKEGTN